MCVCVPLSLSVSNLQSALSLRNRMAAISMKVTPPMKKTTITFLGAELGVFWKTVIGSKGIPLVKLASACTQ
jgi:hypothetical protein